MKKKIEEERDRISDLPDELRTHILSLLPVDEAMAASELSRSWKDLWIKLPSLNFMFHSSFANVLFDKLDAAANCSRRRSQIHKELPLAFLSNFVHRTLVKWSTWSFPCQNSHHYESSIRRSADFVHMYLPPLEVYNITRPKEVAAYHMDRLIECAINEVQVKDLRIRSCSFCQGRHDLRYKLPIEPFMAGSGAGAKYLTQLWLFVINFEAQLFHVLAANCPLLHTLVAQLCCLQGKDSVIKVSGSKLVELRLDRVDGLTKLEITHAPNLRYLVAEATRYIKVDRGHLTQLRNLEYLHLQYCCFVDKRLHISSKRLKSLSLWDCRGLVKLRIHAPSLQEFCCLNNHLNYFFELPHVRPLIKVEIEAPELKSLRCKNVSTITACTEFLLETAYLALDRPSTDEQFLQVLRCLNRSPNLEIDVEDCLFEQNYRKLHMFDHGENQDIPPVIYGVKNLKLTLKGYNYHVWKTLRSHRLSEIINVLLQLSPRPKIISIHLWFCTDPGIDKHLKILEFKYKENNGGVEDCSRCKSLPIRCWQHCLQEVEVKSQIKASKTESHSEMMERLAAEDIDIQDLFQNATSAEKIVVRTTLTASDNS